MSHPLPKELSSVPASTLLLDILALLEKTLPKNLLSFGNY